MALFQLARIRMLSNPKILTCHKLDLRLLLIAMSLLIFIKKKKNAKIVAINLISE